jgi:hypothetical protein
MKVFVTEDEYLKGREKTWPLTPQQRINMRHLLEILNKVRAVLDVPFIVTSGYRPEGINKEIGGAVGSLHISCEAVDLADADGRIKKWFADEGRLEKYGLWMESPIYTPKHCHLQTKAPRSGARIFVPHRKPWLNGV